MAISMDGMTIKLVTIKMKLLLWIFGLLFLVGCQAVTKTQCFPVQFEYNDTEMNDFGSKVIGDMETMMPQYEWRYKVNKIVINFVNRNCVTVTGKIEGD